MGAENVEPRKPTGKANAGGHCGHMPEKARGSRSRENPRYRQASARTSPLADHTRKPSPYGRRGGGIDGTYHRKNKHRACTRMTRQRIITDEMIHDAKRRGWSVARTAREHGCHHTSIGRRAEAMGVVLLDERVRGVKSGCENAPDVKTLCWSVSPAAVRKYAARHKITGAMAR